MTRKIISAHHPVMLLSKYLSQERLTLAEFGKLVGGVEESTVARWRDGASFPTPENIDAIARATRGRVRYDDHLAVRPKRQKNGAA